MNRYKASAIHLGICLLVGALVLALMHHLWYPGPYFGALEAGVLLLIVLGVDVTIGPLITLVIWKTDARRLKFDLTVIGTLQVAALLYGLHVVYEARPVYMVFAVDSFDVVTASDLSEEKLTKAGNSEYAHLPLTGPRIVAARNPADPAEREKILMSSLEGGADLPQMPRYYVPYLEEKAQVLSRLRSLEMLRKKFPQVDTYVSADEKADERWGYLPVRTRRQAFTALVDKRSAEVVRLIPVDPWG
ncbi:MAG: hypothetical protein FJY37_05990 [Betaproteobacteria bacterium]|nr:hypothetical protein [Betaproteobacteria bacterium]